MARKLGRADWLAAAFSALAHRGIEAVRVEPLAKRLGITKGSFYWHFADRGELLAALLAEWEQRATLAIIAAVERRGGSARERLLELFRRAFAADGRLDRRLRAWAEDDPQAAAVMARVDRRRLDYLRHLFTEIGFPPAQADIRSQLVYDALIGGFALTGRAAASPQERDSRARVYHEMLSHS